MTTAKGSFTVTVDDDADISKIELSNGTETYFTRTDGTAVEGAPDVVVAYKKDGHGGETGLLLDIVHDHSADFTWEELVEALRRTADVVESTYARRSGLAELVEALGLDVPKEN